jgi:hypothetical protein
VVGDSPKLGGGAGWVPTHMLTISAPEQALLLPLAAMYVHQFIMHSLLDAHKH